MTTTWRARCSRGHYLAASDVHTSLEPDCWDDTCRCKITPQQWKPSAETFGHEPFEYDGVPICARCGVDFQEPIPGGLRIGTRPVPWPCTSAIVLGLVDREEANR